MDFDNVLATVVKPLAC